MFYGIVGQHKEKNNFNRRLYIKLSYLCIVKPKPDWVLGRDMNILVETLD